MPIDPNMCNCGDLGLNFIASFPEAPAVKRFHEIAKTARDFLFEMESLDGNYLKKFELVWKEMG